MFMNKIISNLLISEHNFIGWLIANLGAFISPSSDIDTDMNKRREIIDEAISLIDKIKEDRLEIFRRGLFTDE